MSLKSCEYCKYIKSHDYDSFKNFFLYAPDFQCVKDSEVYNEEDDFVMIAKHCPYYELASSEELHKRFGDK